MPAPGDGYRDDWGQLTGVGRDEWASPTWRDVSAAETAAARRYEQRIAHLESVILQLRDALAVAKEEPRKPLPDELSSAAAARTFDKELEA